MCHFERQDEILDSVFPGLVDPRCMYHPPVVCLVAFSAKRPLVESQCLCSSDSYLGMVSKPESHNGRVKSRLCKKAQGHHIYSCVGKPMPYTEIGTRISSIDLFPIDRVVM